jgi:hypothetical protein
VQVLLLENEAAQKSFSEKGGWVAIEAMLLRVEDNMKLLTLCEPPSSAGTKGTSGGKTSSSSSSSSSSTMASDSKGNKVASAGGSSTGSKDSQSQSQHPYHVNVLSSIVALIFDDSGYIIPRIDKPHFSVNVIPPPPRGTSLVNAHVLSMLASLANSSRCSIPLVELVCQVAYLMLHVNPINLVILEKSGTVHALCRILGSLACFGRISSPLVSSSASPVQVNAVLSGDPGDDLLDDSVSKSLIADLLAVLRVVAVVSSQRDASILTFLGSLALRLVAPDKSTPANTQPLLRCQNCETETATIECIK